VTPQLTVVVPAFNAAATIGATLSSLRAQTLPELELVVVDDGSTDATGEVVRAVCPEAVLLRQDQSGAGAARAAGIAAATAPLLAFCDADDLFFDRHLEWLVATLRSGPPRGLATANAYWWLPGGIEPRLTRHRGRFPGPGEQRLAILRSNFVSSMSVFPRSMVDEVGTVDASLRHGEDWEFWIRAIYAGYTVTLQPRPSALYRWSTDGLSGQVTAFRASEQTVLRRVLGRDDLTDSERRVAEHRLASPSPIELAGRGDELVRTRRYRDAARAYAAAAALVPTESTLTAKARLMRLAPGIAGPLLRRRASRRAAVLGLDERHRR
jgi:glycosyltransferase involved in cell wall biosynthesis